MSLLALAICTIVCTLSPILVHGSSITRANAERIHEGMTLAEVEAILGGPARDESTGPLVYDAGLDICPEILWRWDQAQIAECRSNSQIIRLTISPNGRVVNCRYSHVRPAQENLCQTAFRLIRLSN